MALAIPSGRARSVEQALRQLVDAVRALADGRSNAVGSVTLAVSATSTDVADPRVGAGSVILLSPASASAAAAAVHVSAVADGGFTLAHDADAATDRRFGYAIQG